MHRSTSNTRHGFTLVELMVVISIIAVLAGILLVALSSATESAAKSQTSSTLNSFAAACDTFALEHGYYPSAVPMRLLGDGSKMTSTQNALLALMGGYRVKMSNQSSGPIADEFDQFVLDSSEQGFIIELTESSGTEWEIAVDPARISEGPFINGKPYPPYFSPKSSEMKRPWSDTTNHNDSDNDGPKARGFNQLPNLYDTWGNPVIYMQQLRKSGALLDGQSSDPGPGGDSLVLGQFSTQGLGRYLEASKLGDNRQTQKQTVLPGGGIIGSRITGENGNGNAEEQQRWLTVALAHPAFYEYDPDQSSTEDLWPYGTARGKYVIWSPGPDGVFLSHQDGPLTQDGGFDPQWEEAVPDSIDSFDDIIVHGGG